MSPYFNAAGYSSKYEAGSLSQPLGAERDEKFFLRWCEWVYGCYSHGTTMNINGGLTRSGRPIEELRAYARGMQSSDKYKKWCDVLVDVASKNSPNVTKGSIMNISWDPVNVLGPMRDIAMSKLGAPKYEPVVRAVDTVSNTQRKLKIAKDRLMADPRMKQLVQQTGVVPEGVSKYSLGMTPSEVEVLTQLASHALPTEVLMQDVLANTLDASNFDTLNGQLNEDIFDLNMMAVEAQIQPNSRKIALKYVDPAGLIAPISKENDCCDIPYVGKIEHISVSQLRRESGLGEKELYLISRQYAKYAHNGKLKGEFPAFTDRGWREEYKANNGEYPYDNFTVCVMTLYFRAGDTENYLVGASQSGGKVFMPWDGEPSDDMQIEQYTREYCYKCKWVVGTQHVFDYGKHMTIRAGEEGSQYAMLPIVMWAGSGPSIVERCIAVIDDIQLATMKIRSLFVNLPPSPRIFIDYSLLQESFNMGGVQVDSMTQLKIFAGTGVLIGKSKSEFDNPNTYGSNRPPVTPLQIGVQEDFNLFSTAIAGKMAELRQLTGVNEVSDGSAAGQDLLIGTAQMLEAASNNSLKPYMAAGLSVYQRLVNVLAKSYQVMALDGPIQFRHWPVGASTMKVLDLTPDIYAYDFSVVARILPTEQEIQLMTQMMISSKQEGALTDLDVFVVMEFLANREVKKAKIYMASAIAKNKEIARQQQLEAIQVQNQGIQQTAVVSEEAKRGTILAEGESEARLVQLKHGLDMERLKAQHEMKMKENAFQGVIDAAQNNSSQ